MTNFDIIAFGGPQFTNTENAEIHALGVASDQVKHTSGSDRALASHYMNASIFVYPSKYEGFGFPPLEAMNQNCPVASSNTSSMPEIIGTAAEFFDPNSSSDISRAIEDVVYSSSRSAELVTLGQARVQNFTWEKCALETLETYQKFIKPF
ncbi:MAG: glycosyltransferase [Rhodobacteraceae bacterium]|nr:glycosyltransferase [Paracoccaceae bacterium]